MKGGRDRGVYIAPRRLSRTKRCRIRMGTAVGAIDFYPQQGCLMTSGVNATLKLGQMLGKK